MMMDRPVLVVGGGIGGLAAALSLAGQGFDVALFEQAPAFGDTGAGIQLSPNCNRVLFDIGLEEPLRAMAFLPEGAEIRDWKNGKIIASSTLGEAVEKDYGFPYFHIHRADLIRVLVTSVREHGGIELRTDCKVTAAEQTSAGVQLTTSQGQFDGDLLIGADGIHSVIREQLFGPAAATFTGHVAWRALAPAERLPEGLVRPATTVWWGPGGHFVHYYVRQGELVNCVCVIEKAGWEVESWHEPGDYEELKADFARWHEDIQTLMAHVERDSLFKWALFDRRPMDRWGRGLATLLGDACHPTLPFMAQGAAMAMEDGAVLARCLAQKGAIEARLRQYEDLRRARTAWVQRGSRRNGKVFHLRGVRARLRNLAANRASGNAIKRLFSYNALSVHS